MAAPQQQHAKLTETDGPYWQTNNELHCDGRIQTHGPAASYAHTTHSVRVSSAAQLNLSLLLLLLLSCTHMCCCFCFWLCLCFGIVVARANYYSTTHLGLRTVLAGVGHCCCLACQPASQAQSASQPFQPASQISQTQTDRQSAMASCRHRSSRRRRRQHEEAEAAATAAQAVLSSDSTHL